MTVQDMEVNRHVRAVFARNWVNLQKIDYGASHGTVYINGRLSLLHEPPPDSKEDRDRTGVGPRFLNHLHKELLKVPGVRAVRWNIEGWQRTGIAWVLKGAV